MWPSLLFCNTFILCLAKDTHINESKSQIENGFLILAPFTLMADFSGPSLDKYKLYQERTRTSDFPSLRASLPGYVVPMECVDLHRRMESM